jgi:hypothetical protein
LLAVLLALTAPAHATDEPPAKPAAVAPDPARWLAGYDSLRLALAGDDSPAAAAAAQAMATAADGDAELAAAANRAASTTDVAGMRKAFSELSRLVIQRLSGAGSPRVLVYHCAMYEGFAYWVQPKAGIANPYMGRAMPECGEEVSLKAAAKAAAGRG